MIKMNKFWSYLVVSLFCLSLTSGSVVFAANPAKQLAKGISLYEQNKDSEAMDYFIDVMVSGNKEQVAEANKYVGLIHDRIGGIQTPVEVNVNFKEGEVKSLNDTTSEAVRAAQEEAEAAAQEAAAKAQAAKEEAAAKAAAQADDALAEVEAQQQALNDRIMAERRAAQEKAAQMREDAAQKAAALNEAAAQAAVTGATVPAAQTEGDVVVISDESEPETEPEPAPAVVQTPVVQEEPRRESVLSTTTEPATSTFADLTSPEAVRAREIYTEQKLDSMTSAAVEKITAAKGVHLYFRDNLPDALDIDADVLFDGGKFRPEALPLLNSIYELLALTQGASYTILPPGSYTDDVTLSGIRQAMAFNSYFINRGISQGKLHYNLGLVDQEPPARFANLNGLAVVFDFKGQLPTRMEKNDGNEKAPLLSMAIVPQCHAIDRALGEAYAIDFSVLETVNPIDNWVLQVVQHGRDGNFYVVRQLEGFTPVYHQILWNGRKGIIGPELPCGKYTLVLTATDLKGQKQTLRRRVIVKCSEQKTSACTTGTCGAKTAASSDNLCPKCNYKTARLWVKPGRTMAAAAVTNETQPAAVPEQPAQPAETQTPDAMASDPLGTDLPSAADSSAPADLPVNNPYDMPYEQYGN